MTAPKDVHSAGAAHTPTPWVANFRPYAGWVQKRGALCEITNERGIKVYAGPASFHALTGANATEAIANAHRIVECVNGYDDLRASNAELRAALREAIDAANAANTGRKISAEVIGNWSDLAGGAA